MSLFRSASTRETGPDVIIWIGKTGRAGVPLALTSKTTEELLGMKALFEYAFELAEPIVRKRDEDARADFDRGDDTNPRIYRGVPEVAVRPWTEGIDGSSVLQRFEDLPAGDADEERASIPTGGYGGHLDKRLTPPGIAADYDAEIEQYKEFRELSQAGDSE